MSNVTSVIASEVLQATDVPASVVSGLRALLAPDVPVDVDGIDRRLAENAALAGEIQRFLDEASTTTSSVAKAVDLAHAHLLREAGDWAAALARYTAVVERDPQNATAEFFSADCCLQLGRTDDAVAHLRRTEALSPDEPDDAALVAQVYDHMGRRDDALAAARRARELATSRAMDPARQHQLAAVLLNSGEGNAAVEVLDALLERTDVDDDLLAEAAELLAQLHVAEERPAAAEEVLARLEQRLGTLSSRPVSRLTMAAALLDQLEAADALAYADAGLLDQVPAGQRRRAAYVRGAALLETHDPQQAVGLLAEASRGAEDLMASLARLLQSIALIGIGDRAGARQLLDDLAIRGPEHLPPWLQGRTALYRGIAWSEIDSEKASQCLAEADEKLPADSPERPLLTVQQAFQLRTREPAVAIELLDRLPEDAGSLAPLAARTRYEAQLAQGHLDDAEAALGILLERASVDERPWILLRRADARRLLGDREGALDDIEAARAQGAGQELADQARFVEARVHLDSSQIDAASRLLGSLRRDGADERWRRQMLDLELAIATAAGDTDAVADALAAMAELDPAILPLARLTSGDAATLAGDVGRGRQLLESVVEPLDPAEPHHLVIAAYARRVLDREGADELIEQAKAIEPAIVSWPLAVLERALGAFNRKDVATLDQLLADAGPINRLLLLNLRAATRQRIEPPDLEGALADLAELTELATGSDGPSDIARLLSAQASALRALVLLRCDRLDEVAQELELARQAAAGLPEHGLHNALRAQAEGILHLRQGRHAEADAGLAEASRLLELAGIDDLGYVVDYLRGVNAMLQDDREEDALRWLRKAAASQPEDSDVLEALGDVLLQLEDPQGAFNAYEAALASASGDARRASLLLDRAIALRKLGRLDAGLEAARASLDLVPDQHRAWLVLATLHEAAGRTDATVAAFKRGLALSDGGATRIRLLVGLSHTYLTAGRPRDAIALLSAPQSRSLAREEGLIAYNLGVAYFEVGELDHAAAQFEAAARASAPRADAAELAVRVRRSKASQASWMGFWFVGQGPARRATGTLLLGLGVLALAVALVDTTRVSWLRWMATSGPRTLAPLVVVAVLYLLPVVTKLKIGDVELEQPVSASAEALKPAPANWEAVRRKVMAAAVLAQTATVAGPTRPVPLAAAVGAPPLEPPPSS